MEISMQENNLEISSMGLMSIVLQMIIGMKVVKKFVDNPLFEIGFVKVDTWKEDSKHTLSIYISPKTPWPQL